jgi:hypothetical protein
MTRGRQLLLAGTLGLAGAVLLRAGGERVVEELPCLLRAALGLAQGEGPLVCLVWEASDGGPAAQACAGWRDGRPWLGIDARRGGN